MIVKTHISKDKNVYIEYASNCYIIILWNKRASMNAWSSTLSSL